MRDLAVSVGRMLGNVARWKRQLLCHHDYLWAFEKKRTFLRCGKCNHETPGFDMTGIKPPIQKFAGDSARHVVGRA
jgi:hypothetical protein